MTNQPEHDLDMVREQSREQMREFVGYLLRWYATRTVRTIRQSKGKQPRAVRVSRLLNLIAEKPAIKSRGF